MSFKVVALDKGTHQREQFDCGVESLNHYLKQQATQDQKRNIARPFVLIKEGSQEVLGYYTLSSGSISLSDIPESERKRLPNYPLVPVILIGRLAVDRNHKGAGLGKILMVNALRRIFAINQEAAAYAVIVDAIDEDAANFYRKFGFYEIQSLSHRLMLPLKTLEKLLVQE